MGSRLPIRWRLALWYAAFLLVALALFASGLFFGLHQILYASLDDTLRAQAALTSATIQIRGGVPRIPDGSLPTSRTGGQYIRLADQTGQITVDTSAGGKYLLQDPIGMTAALEGATVLNWVRVEDHSMRVLSEPIRIDGANVGALQVGILDTEVEETLHIVMGLIGILGPLVLVIVSLGGVWFARRALDPLSRMADLAAEIEAYDLSRRIDPGLPQDEVGRLARTFNAMLDRLEAAFQRQRQFTADASHELRTPLALLQSQIEVALAAPRTPVADQLTFTALADDVGRLSHITGTLLALARGDGGMLDLSRDDVDLAETFGLIAEQYGSLMDDAGVRLVVDTEPIHLVADEDRLIQLLVNLVDNALHATSAGGRITLGCRTEDHEICIWVRDTGCGIAAAHLPHVFERFYRVETSRSRTHGGVGLGLNICRMIVEAHGGRIQVTSEPGQGTVVTVRLPLSDVPVAP